MKQNSLQSSCCIGPIRAWDILGSEMSENLQITDNGLSKDFNNIVQVLVIILGQLISENMDINRILVNINNIRMYRDRDIYCNNQESFSLLEEKIPGLTSRIDKLDSIVEGLKRDFLSLKDNFSELNKEGLVRHVGCLIQQIQDILNSHTFPLSGEITTNTQINEVLDTE